MYVVFDVIGTVFSLQKVRAALALQFSERDAVELWFTRMLQSAMTQTLAGQYVPLQQLAEAALKQLAAQRGHREWDPSGVLQELQQLDPWEDAAECFEDLKKEHSIIALTNSSRNLANSLLQRANLLQYFSEVLSADDVGRCKPHPEPYQAAVNKLGIEPQLACLVAVHGWDIVGASAVGMQTIWVSRTEKSWGFPGDPPGKTAKTLSDVPRLVGELS